MPPSSPKADLVSQTVIEFPGLQGVMGGIFARAAGERDCVADAVAEQYLPVSATAPLPRTLAGALLAVAEKVDNIAGAWIAGEKPSGSRDPYGLRRAAIGIVRIGLQFSLRLPLRPLFEWAVDQYEIQVLLDEDARALLGDEAARAALVDEMQAFVLERLQALLLEEALPYPSVEAALAAPGGDLPGWAARARAFAALAGRPFFEDAVVAYNRCFSLASKAAGAAAAADDGPRAPPGPRRRRRRPGALQRGGRARPRGGPRRRRARRRGRARPPRARERPRRRRPPAGAGRPLLRRRAGHGQGPAPPRQPPRPARRRRRRPRAHRRVQPPAAPGRPDVAAPTLTGMTTAHRPHHVSHARRRPRRI